MERIETQQMGLMAMMPVLVIPVVVPFHQVASLAYVVRTQTVEGCLQSLCVCLVDTQDLRTLDGVLEKLTDNG